MLEPQRVFLKDEEISPLIMFIVTTTCLPVQPGGEGLFTGGSYEL
jgi:hypothetical protein